MVKRTAYTPPPVEIFKWSGLHFGGNLGNARVRGGWYEGFSVGSPATAAMEGSLVAARSAITTNSPTAVPVLGAEADFGLAGARMAPELISQLLGSPGHFRRCVDHNGGGSLRFCKRPLAVLCQGWRRMRSAARASRSAT